MTAILGEKNSQTQVFNEKGNRVPVTKINAHPCFLVNIKWPETTGTCAIQLGFGQTKNIAKSKVGQYNKAGIKTPLRHLKEIRFDPENKKIQKIEDGKKVGIQIGEVKFFIGDEFKPSLLFKAGDIVKVSAKSKGKGFQGVVRRHKFAGGPRTHGQSDRERAPGSISSGTTPGRVPKGRRMAGRMGGGRATIRNLKVVEVADDSMTISGLVPGATGAIVEIRSNSL